MLCRNGLIGLTGGEVATLTDFTDVRDRQSTFKDRGITPVPAVDESKTVPAYFLIKDPDGNTLLFDQHVASPSQ